MAKEVDLLSYWMPVLRNLKEFKEIAKAEEPELRYILEAIDRTINNLFINTADEYGISRFESMMGVFPEDVDSLDTRKTRLLTKWNDKVPYTDSAMDEKLSSICGDGNFSVISDYGNYLLSVITHLEDNGSFDALVSYLKEIIPCNILADFRNELSVSSNMPVYAGGVSVVTERVVSTNDLVKSVISDTGLYVGTVASYISERFFVTNDVVDSVSVSVKGYIGMVSTVKDVISVQ